MSDAEKIINEEENYDVLKEFFKEWKMSDAKKIINNNKEALKEFFTGIASCEYYDGRCHRLYLDLDDNSIYEIVEASANTWRQRDDGSLVVIDTVSGYCDTPKNERFSISKGDCLDDYGFLDWLEEMKEEVGEALYEWAEEQSENE